jgi:protein-tyrosine phosphatase
MATKKVLFVCLGNICRSPAAEAVMIKLITDRNLENLIEVDSAGLIEYHVGETADPRMAEAAAERGFNLKGTARKFDFRKDFENFDYIITMDDSNFEDIKSLDFQNVYGDKIYKMVSFSKRLVVPEVPDPYFGGRKGFDTVLDILEDAADGLLDKIQNDILPKD